MSQSQFQQNIPEHEHHFSDIPFFTGVVECLITDPMCAYNSLHVMQASSTGPE